VPNLHVATLNSVEQAVARGEEQQYSAVIVDEGQDVTWGQWSTLDRCLLPEHGLLRVMFDSNQAVYRARDDIETRLSAECFPLRVNLRNTRCIARVTEGLYRGPLIIPAGPEGQPFIVLQGTADAAATKATDAVISLIRDEGIAPGDIAILGATPKIVSETKGRLLTARISVSEALTRASQSIVVDTIASFKGLEALVTVMAVDHTSANSAELCYVGASRARALLVVAGPIAGTALERALVAAAENVPRVEP
jgi:superfamily I DNA/RNA helicase